MRLIVLGGLSLERPECDTVPLVGAATQRKPLALLAVLVAAGRQGPEDARVGVAVSRERLSALLWPEADETHARQTLKQTLSSLRRDLRTDPFLGSADVRLDPSRIACDLWEFEDALARGEAARAVTLYRGPFLDGVHVRGAAGFEDWADAERARLARRHIGALETLAGEAERRADLAAALEWRRRLAAADPVSERQALALMRTLAAVGETAAALRHARIHATLVAQEFGTEPSSEFRTFVERLRAARGSPTSTPVAPVTAGSAAMPGPGVTAPGDPAPEASGIDAPIAERATGPVDAPPRAAPALEPPPAPPARAAGRGRARRRALLLFVTAVAGVLAVAAKVRPRPALHAGATPGASARGVLDPRKVVVTPLGGRAASAGDAVLAADPGHLAADWLTQGLVQTRLVSVVPIGALAAGAPGARDGAVDARTALVAAREVGAGLLVTGTYTVARDSLVLTTRILDVRDGTVLRAVGPVAAPADRPLLAAESLRRLTVAALATVVDARLAGWAGAASQPTSFEAYQAFSEGLTAFFARGEQGGNRDPQPLFHRAHALDTAFTAPLIWALFRADRAESDSIYRYLEPRRARLAPWDQYVLDFFQRRDAQEGYQAFRRVVALAPQSEWLYMLAYTANATNRPRTAIRALRRLDPDRGWMREWASYWGVLATAHHLVGEDVEGLRVVQQGLRRFPNDRRLLEIQIAVLAALSRDDELARTLDAWYHATMRSDVPRRDPLFVLMELRRHGRWAQLAETAARLLAGIDALGTRVRPEDARLFRAQVLWMTDRWAEAEAVLAPIPPSAPAFAEALRLRAQLAARRGDRKEALQLTREFGARQPAYRLNTLSASVHAFLGDLNEAVLLIGTPSRSSVLWEWVHRELAFERIRDTPAFAALVAPRDEVEDGATSGR